MKHSCYSKYIFLVILIYSNLFANLNDKSAVLYYGKHISYPMVGIHDYIIVQPSHINTYRHGFKVYNDKMYAYISIGEVDKNTKEYADIKKKWILGKNKAWNSSVLDLSNPEYKQFLFQKLIEPQIKRGFKNFFFDTLDSYQLVSKTKKELKKNEDALVDIINTFHKKYPKSKLIINRGFEIIDRIHNSINAVLFESYYHGLSGVKLSYNRVSKNDRKWLDTYLNKIKKYNLDIICVDYLPLEYLNSKIAKKTLVDIKNKGMIPYITTKSLLTYGISSKKALKREILTLIDESKQDRIFQAAHQYGALPLEYQGYIQTLYNIGKKPLPAMKKMRQYKGVVIWLGDEYKNPNKLVDWILKLQKYNIKVVFAGSIPIPSDSLLRLFIKENDSFKKAQSSKIYIKDPIVGYEVQPNSHNADTFVDITKGKRLFSIKDSNGVINTYAAIMPWGGFAVRNAFMQEFNDDNLWVINPFKFFKKALRLQDIAIPDVTTQNGKRILFSHLDGDAIMNRVEWDPKLFSGDIIYKDVLKKYTLPISISIVGAEVDDNGLYQKIAPRLQQIVKNIYKLPNIEAATHTFSHPMKWEKIKNDNLDPKYRLDPKGYHFSIENETKGMLDEINVKYLPKNKYPKAHTVFWSGDCIPPEVVLEYVYKHNLLNINGGDTYITNIHPWLSYIAPLGLKRGDYYQIYTGQQNENIYTDEWHGPYWGFKKVIQTFKLTDKPKRLKPIDVYYHYYSGSKRASLNALRYVYDWVLKQDINPIFTSQYIPKVMDYYTVSIAKNNNKYLLSGMKSLKTIRLDNTKYIDIKDSKNLLGYKTLNKHSYIHLGKLSDALIITSNTKKDHNGYLVSTNAQVIKSKFNDKGFNMQLKSFIPLKIELNVPKACKLDLNKEAEDITQNGNIIAINYKKNREVVLNVRCR